jgi:hypothetical protein
MPTKSGNKFEDEVDALYQLPLAEFTAARNAFAGRLKKDGRGNEADFVKTLTKPSVSAWVVNQVYWQHREAFTRLVATSERFREAQSSGSAKKMTEMRGALDARRESLAQVANLATTVLREAGNNPTPDTIHRVTTTLDAMSIYASMPDGPRVGRLTQDVDPPGFESFASFTPSHGLTGRAKESARVTPAQESAGQRKTGKTELAAAARQLEETRQVKVAAAKASLQEAKTLLLEARAKVKSLEAAQKKVIAEAKDAEKERRDAAARFEKAKAAAEETTRTAQSVAAEAKLAAESVEVAKRSVEKAAKELEKSFRE